MTLSVKNTPQQALNFVLKYNDKPLLDFNLSELGKCLKRCAFLHHPDRTGGSDELMKQLNEARLTLKNTSESTLKQLISDIKAAWKADIDLKEHPLFEANVPNWNTYDDLLNQQFKIVDNNLEPLRSKPTINSIKVWTTSGIEVRAIACSPTLHEVVLFDGSNSLKWNGKVHCFIVRLLTKTSDSRSVWGTIDTLLEQTGCEGIRELYDYLETNDQLSLGDEYEAVYVSKVSEMARYSVSPNNLGKLARVRSSDLKKALGSSKLSFLFLCRILANGQFHNFYMKEGRDFYGDKYYAQMVSNPFFMFDRISGIEWLRIDGEEECCTISFQFTRRNYSLDVALNNRYPTTENLRKAEQGYISLNG